MAIEGGDLFSLLDSRRKRRIQQPGLLKDRFPDTQTVFDGECLFPPGDIGALNEDSRTWRKRDDVFFNQVLPSLRVDQRSERKSVERPIGNDKNLFAGIQLRLNRLDQKLI